MSAVFFSQHGEDAVLAELFQSPRGEFAEIGCIDGCRFSNSLHFERKGWRGLCVEAHPDFIPLLRRNRPSSAVVHAAVGRHELPEVTFYANRRGSLSTLDPNKESEFKERFPEWFFGFDPVKVPLRKFSTIMDESGITDLDFLSIDVEGSELDVLQGIDFARHRPRVIVAEADTTDARESLTTYLAQNKYRFIGFVANNAFYAEAGFPTPTLVTSRKFVIQLTVSPHPLDEQVERTSTVEVIWHAATK